jgi:PST family polysaccharide transporter
MRKIIKISSVLGVATLIKILAGFARAKFLAWQLGPLGMGIIGQAQMYFAFIIQLCSLNIGLGITKDISQNIANNDNKKTAFIADTAFTVQFVAALLFIIAVLPFSARLTRFVFADQKYWIYFIGITCVAPLATYFTGVADPILYGFKKIPECTKMMIAYTLTGLVLVFALVWFYKTNGMLVQIMLIAAASFLISRWFLKSSTSIDPKVNLGIFREGGFRDTASHLFKYGLISFIPANVGMVTILFLRSTFMKVYGVEANGYYQVAYAVSAYYLPFLTNGIWGHFYPEMCALRTKEEINRELNQFFRFSVFASTAIALGCIIFRRYVILILFSRKFVSAYDLLAIQAVGDVFLILFIMFSTSLIARKNFKSVIVISTIGYNLVFVSMFFFLHKMFSFGFRDLNIALAFTNFALVVVHMMYARHETGFTLTGGNGILVVKSGLFLALILLLPDRTILDIAVKLALAIVWAIFSMTRKEMDSSTQAAFSLFKRWKDR